MLRKGRFTLLAVLLLLVFSQTAFANLASFGPLHPAGHFPQWYMDTNGVAIALPVPVVGDGVNPPTMIFDDPDPANPFSVTIGFGSEAFYWHAVSTMNIRGGPARAILVLGLEAAFGGGAALDGDQMVFGRVRIRVDCPVAGRYTVTHPYGTAIFDVATPGVNSINFTSDVGGITPDFGRALTSPIGPFLVAVSPAPPVGWVGNGVTPTTVTGSPTGFNRWRIDGPPGSNLNGAGSDSIQTPRFVVSGVRFAGAVPTALVVDRAVYSRTPTETIVDVFATSATTATCTASIGIANFPMRRGNAPGPLAGKFFVRATFPNPFPLPTTINVTAVNGAQTPTTITRSLVDDVTIGAATYNAVSRALSIAAASGDGGAPPAPPPTLTITSPALGVITGGVNTTTRPVPPASVTVNSSAGGSDIHTVKILP